MEIEFVRHPDLPDTSPPLAARLGDLVFTGGGVPAHPTEGVPPDAKLDPTDPSRGSQIERQKRYILKEMKTTLEAAGASIKRVMKINSYSEPAQPVEHEMALRVRPEFFGVNDPPPSTSVGMSETPVHGGALAIDAVALAEGPDLKRDVIDTSQVRHPKWSLLPGGPPIYLEVVRGGGFVFSAGTGAPDQRGPLEPAYGHPDFPYHHNEMKLQCEYTLDVLSEFLVAAGSSLEHVVKAEIHLADIGDYADMDEVWRRYFPVDPPARHVVPVNELLLESMLIEIELVAVDPNGPYRKETISTDKAPQSAGHEPQAVKAGPYVFLSSQMATDFSKGVAPEAQPDPNFPFGSPAPIKRQVEYILRNVDAICQAAGTSSANLLRRRGFHTDLKEWANAEEVWAAALEERLPPTTTVRVPEPLPVPGCRVLYDLVAGIPG